MPTPGSHLAHTKQQEEILDLLVEAQLPRAATLPLRTAAALVLALANSGYYQRAFFSEVAAGAVVGLSALPAGEVPVVVTVLVAGFSAAGHYEEALFDALAAKVGAVGVATVVLCSVSGCGMGWW